MKMYVIPIFAVLLSLSFVSAANHDFEIPRQISGDEARQSGVTDSEANETGGSLTAPAGLSRAMVMVDNEAARMRLEDNYERFMAMHDTVIGDDSMVSLSEAPGNRTLAKFVNQVRFLGIFPVQAEEDILIENGAPVDVRRNVWARLVNLGVAG